MLAAAVRYDELQAPNKLNDFYDYEVEFGKIWQWLGREVLEKNIGGLPVDKRKKKNLTTLGYVTIANKHAFSTGKNGFQISPRIQELMVFAGQMDCYANCHEVINQYLDEQVSSAQIHRVSDVYGEEVGKTINEHFVFISNNFCQ